MRNTIRNGRSFSIIAALLLTSLACLFWGCQTKPAAGYLEKSFLNPPDSAKPYAFWVWFAGGGRWSKEGATADLEAMKRVGINGVIIMGNPATLSTEWREKFKYSVAEAARLGMEVTAYNGPGWAGSGGSWIGPEQASKKLVWTETTIEGPQHFEGGLKQPEGFAWGPPDKVTKAQPIYYNDEAVLAFPTPERTDSILNLREKSLFARGYCSGYGGGGIAVIVPPGKFPAPEPGTTVQSDRLVDLTTRMDKTGRLAWEVPAGKWTVLRFGYCPTGALVQPTKQGLECDKMSKEALDVHFQALMAQLIADVGPLAGKGKTLVATHIDSWEAGPLNWTPLFREEFRKRRGYDPLLFLPVLTNRVLDNLDVSERFLWDFRQTISDLIVENYAGHMQSLAQQNGLRLSIEGYDGSPCDDMTYGGRADVPMGEFWCDTYQTKYSCTEMASTAHVYGKKVVQAEAFTSENFGPDGGWYYHPAATKSLGDWALCEGVNRFVFHNFTHQPDLNRKPGVIWFGAYHQRNQTWWELSTAYHRYLARCQFLLQQGLFVADICYLAPEASPQYFLSPQDRSEYNYDGCTAEAVLTRMSVKDGRLVLPDGMSYRLLVLPKLSTMTPSLLRKIKQLVEDGATVVGPRPLRSPSLQDYPQCDQELKSLADDLWGNCDGRTVKERSVGKGRILWGDDSLPLYDAVVSRCSPSYPSYAELYPPLSWLHACLSAIGTPPDFTSGTGFKCIHRRVGDTDLYFIANPEPVSREADCTFRVTGKQPELWNPDAGTAQRQILYREKDGLTTLPLRLGPSGSVFVVFRKSVSTTVPVISVSRDGANIVPDPALPSSGWASMELLAGAGNKVDFLGWEPGHYELKAADGKSATVEVKGIPAIQITGPWEVSFPPNWGAPDRLTLDKLMSWTEHSDPGVKYYSGTATYRKKILVPPELLSKNRRLCLDLGNVRVMAQVKLNGEDLGILWTPPFRVDITAAVRPGENTLEIVVANLWANRLIGDMLLPAEKRFTQGGGKLEPNAPLAESGLIGPVRIVTGELAEVVFSGHSGTLAAEQWAVFETSFTSSVKYINAFTEVEVDVVFRQGEKQWKVPAFWAGDKKWTVRFAPPVQGNYTYRIECTDKGNSGLNGKEQTLSVATYKGDNPLLKHGFVQASPGKTYFEHADGTPFLWLADTWWKCLCKRMTWEGFQELTADRKAKGFSVVQIVCGPYPDENFFAPSLENEGGQPYLQKDMSVVNPKYFDYADRRFRHLVAAGIVPAIVGAWGRGDCNSMDKFGAVNIKRHWRYLIARYSAYPVMWILAGEIADETKWGKGPWADVAKYVREIDPYKHPLTCHTGQGRRGAEGDNSLIDYDMVGGNHDEREAVANGTLTLLASAIAKKPAMPVLCGETCYEGHMQQGFGDVQRHIFWRNMLSGAAGHTYGSAGIWHAGVEGNPGNWGAWDRQPYDFTTWKEGMNYPGSTQLGIGKKLLEQYPWSRFEVHPEWVENNCFAAGIPGEVRFIYLPRRNIYNWDGPEVKNLEPDVDWHVYYFDPATGRKFDQGTIKATAKSGDKVAKPVNFRKNVPSPQDWVLVFEAIL